MSTPETDGRNRTLMMVGIGSGLLVVGLATGYFLGTGSAAAAKTEADAALKGANDRAAFAEGELTKIKTDADAAKKACDVDLKLGHAVELTLRAGYEAKAANFGTAGEFLNNAMIELRAVQKLVSPEGAKELEDVIKNYDPASGELLKRSDGSADKIKESAAILIAAREGGIR